VQPAKPIEERFQKRLNPVQAPVVLAPTETIGQVALLKKHRLSGPEVAFEKAGSRQGDGDHLCVDEGALGAFLVVPGSEPIVDEAVHFDDCSMIAVSRAGPFGEDDVMVNVSKIG